MIFGAGGVVLTMLKMLVSRGLSNVVLINMDKNKVELARSFGASKSFVIENKVKCVETLYGLYGNDLPTVAIETTGKVPCIEISYELSGPKARVIIVGVLKKGEKSSTYTLPLHFGKVL